MLYSQRLLSACVPGLNMLCLQGSMLQQVQALTQLLQQTVSEAGQQPFRSLPTLAVSFTTSHMQESASGLSASRSSEKVQEAYSALLEQALSQLQLLGEVFAQESNRGKHKEHHKAQEGLYGLLEALAKVFLLMLCNNVLFKCLRMAESAGSCAAVVRAFWLC